MLPKSYGDKIELTPQYENTDKSIIVQFVKPSGITA